MLRHPKFESRPRPPHPVGTPAPGPWIAHTDGCHQVWTSTGLVAVVYDGNDEGVNDHERAEANAQLIAHASALAESHARLLDMCRMALPVLRSQLSLNWQASVRDDVDAMRDAIEAGEKVTP